MALFRVEVSDPLRDPDQLAELALQLAARLREADIDVPDPPRRDAEPGARGPEHVSAGVLFVQAALESGAVRWLVEKVRGWLDHVEDASVEIHLGDASIVMSRATKEQQDQLVAHFIHATSQAK